MGKDLWRSSRFTPGHRVLSNWVLNTSKAGDLRAPLCKYSSLIVKNLFFRTVWNFPCCSLQLFLFTFCSLPVKTAWSHCLYNPSLSNGRQGLDSSLSFLLWRLSKHSSLSLCIRHPRPLTILVIPSPFSLSLSILDCADAEGGEIGCDSLGVTRQAKGKNFQAAGSALASATHDMTHLSWGKGTLQAHVQPVVHPQVHFCRLNAVT